MSIPTFCTLFDKNYLPQGLALMHSLAEHYGANHKLYVLALDETVYGQLMMRAHTVALEEVATPELWSALEGRDAGERAWTLAPYWTDWLLQNEQPETLIYLDADSYLFARLDPLYSELKSSSVGIVPHRFPPRLAWRAEHNGVFNVNAVFFRNDPVGLACAHTWRNQCLLECPRQSYRSAEGQLVFGDQGYLDAWVRLYDAHVVEHIGVNLAPWNQEQYSYVYDHHLYVVRHYDSARQHVAQIARLLLYHFHELRMDGGVVRYGGYERYLKPEVLEHAYSPYVKQLLQQRVVVAE